MRISSPGDAGLLITFRPAAKLQPLKPLTEYDQKVVRMRQRGLIYPYEIIKMLTPAAGGHAGASSRPAISWSTISTRTASLVPVDRPYGQNKSNIIVGRDSQLHHQVSRGHDAGAAAGRSEQGSGRARRTRVPSHSRGPGSGRREEDVPLEWFAISAGAKISMDSGVENMDWIARVLRRLIEFTQAGGEVNLVVERHQRRARSPTGMPRPPC